VLKLTISEHFLIWSVLFALWSIVSYGLMADPLPEDRQGSSFQWQAWRWSLVLRIVVAILFSYLVCNSVIVSAWLAAMVAMQPWLRFRSHKKWTAELEILLAVLNVLFVFAFVRKFDLQVHAHLALPIAKEHIAAISIVSGVLLFVIRGGTYIVRGCLRKTEALPRLGSNQRSTSEIAITTATPTATIPPPATALDGLTAEEDTGAKKIDLVEINRGRLIGNLERLLLTLVVIAGSYAALGFLVAAKGLIRSEELQEREFAEYFLVGSLCSVLVALCAGLVIRYTLLALWPELLSLQMQGS
jgi:hypothetical protein